MPLELIVAISGMIGVWGSDYEETLNISDWSVPLLSDWRKLSNTKLKDWLWDNLRDYFKAIKEKFGTPVSAENEEEFCIGVSWLAMEDILRAFLMGSLQDFYQMKVNYEEGQVITFINKSVDEDTRLYDLFPPMMFCTAATEASRRFLCSQDADLRRCINVDHPYTIWLLKSAAVLNKYYNRQFKQIVDAFCNSDAKYTIDICNQIREQLLAFADCHGIDMTICPQLKEADFWVPTDAPEEM